MNVSSVIVTYNGIQWIEKCIESLLKSSIKLDIIIIDNGSTDGTQSIIKRYSEIVFIQSKENLGFGKANNIGIKKAQELGANYVFLLNQDACVETNTIERLIKISNKNPIFGIISPIHLNGKGNALDIRFSTYISPSINHPNYSFLSDLYLSNIKDYYEVDFVNAAAWLLTKNCIDKVGYFDPIFYHYGEDENYCHRVKFHKFKIAICPDSIIYHDRDVRELKPDLSEEFYKRRLLIDYSNPLIPDTSHNSKEADLLKHYKKLRIKNLLRLKFKKAKENNIMITFLMDSFEKTKIQRNKNKMIK